MKTTFEIEYTDDLAEFDAQWNEESLKDFLYQYNKYVMTFYENHDAGSQPVCMVEFFNNDYQLLEESTAEAGV